jgi:protoporphyrinogen oxidase
VEGGYAVVLDRLRTAVQARGVEIRCSRPATAVRGDARGAEIETSRTDTPEKAEASDGQRVPERFDDVVLTVPCGQVATLCPQLTATERERLRKINYQGVICPSLLLRRPLAGYYVTNITDSWVPFTGVIEMTALVDRSTFGGHALVYLPRYLSQSDPTWQRTDSSLLSESIEALGRMYPDFRADDVIASRVARARDVQAISTLNYSSDLLPPLATSIDHVFVVNSAQIAYGTLNVNETLALAARQANALAPLLRNGAGPSVAATAAASQDNGGRAAGVVTASIRTVPARA